VSKKTLIYVPIEPLVERYTESWYRNFPVLFKEAGFDDVLVVDGNVLEKEVKVGTFLDINSTTHYKWSQLQFISKMFHVGAVPHGTVFFFGDLEFWGIEAVRLLADMNNVKVYLTAFLHAASYTHEDAFEIATPYQQYTEVGWIAAMDKVFVGSQYHKSAVAERRLVPLSAMDLYNRIHVTKNPLFAEDYDGWDKRHVKQKKVLLTNRFDPEKRPEQTLWVFEQLKRDFTDWEFVVTTSRSTLRGREDHLAYARRLEEEGVITIKAGLSKAEYHNELKEAAVVVTHSIEEHYGYCIAEAMIYGCIPLMRQGLSHAEFVDDPRLFFNSKTNSMIKLENILDTWNTPEWPTLPPLDLAGASRIVEHLKEFIK